jgi:hypothetical protein
MPNIDCVGDSAVSLRFPGTTTSVLLLEQERCAASAVDRHF